MIKLSRRQIKNADRVGGINLIIDWPADLPLGGPVKPDYEREATAAERAAALAMVSASCQANGLVPVHVRVVNVKRPKEFPRGSQYDQHLAITIIGQRWVHATGQRDRDPPDMWVTAG